MKSSLFRFVLSVALAAAPAVHAEPQVAFDYEEPASLEFHKQEGERDYFLLRQANLVDRERNHSFIKDALPHPDTAISRIADGVGVDGSRGFELEFAADEKTQEHAKERMETYIVAGSDRDAALQLGQVRYLGYSLYIDPECPLPGDHATITQCWQLPVSKESFESGAHSTVRTVSLWMAFQNIDGQPGYQLHVKNEGKPVDGKFSPKSVIAGRGAFKPGWNTLIYRFEPRHQYDPKPGRITLWVNTLDESNPTHERVYNWGVTPQDEVPAGTPDTGYQRYFDIRFGIYRPKQPQRIRLVYDNVRYGETFADVLPESAPSATP